MTYGNETYGGSALGSTSDSEDAAVTRAEATTTASTTVVAAEATATTTANASTTAVADATGVAETIAAADAQTSASATTTSAGAATSTASASTSATSVASNATLEEPSVEWRVIRDGSEVEDAVFDVDPVVDTANPFGDYAVAKMDDRGGEKFEDYPRGTRIDVEVSENFGITFDRRFTGYVVERRETEQSGADVLEVEAYSFDQFLRRNTVTNDQTGNTIVEALADIIQTDTPVSFVAGNIDVGDDQELTRGYQGEAVENVLRDLAFKSNNEDFGVNDDLEFFFRPRETTHIDRGIANSQWFNYDIPELGKEAINEVEVWFADGEESVIVDDGTDKLDLQDSLGLPDPGTQRKELNRPLISDISDAEDIGRKYLAFRNSTLSGTITTYGLFDAQPGDTIDIVVEPRGINSEFVIAGIEYRWGVDQTILTIVEKRGDVDDILSELSDSVQRVEMEGANRDAPKNRITTTNAGAVVDVDVNAGGETPDGVRFVNDGRRKVRDAWTGGSPPDISAVVLGDDGAGLSRSNQSLRNQTASESVTEFLPDSKTVAYSADVASQSIQEVGLETADGTLIARAVFDSEVILVDDSVSVTLTVSNDDSVSRGVLTNDGQTAVRDVLANNNPPVPNQYAYGSDSTGVAESDSALGNELVTVSLEEILIQDADSESEWSELVGDINADVPLSVSMGDYGVLQSCFTTEGENADDDVIGFTGDYRKPDQYSNGNDLTLSRGPNAGGPDYGEWNFALDYTIPAGDFQLAVHHDSDYDPGQQVGSGAPVYEWTLVHENGQTYALNDTPNLGQQFGVRWDELGGTILGGGYTGPDLEPGSYTLRCEITDSDGLANEYAYYVDVVAPYDTGDRFGGIPYQFGSTSSGGYFDGPELFPDLVERSLSTAGTRRNVTEANFSLAANDVSNNFYVELANDGQTFTRVDNSETGSVSFASPERGVDTNIGLGRYGQRSTATPQQGYLGQSIDTWNLFANPDAVVPDNIGETNTRAVVPAGTITGETVREAGLKSDGTLLSRHVLAEFTVLEGQRLASSETTTFTGDN